MAALKVYLASPFFNDYELACVKRAEKILLARGFDLFSPRLHEVRDKAVVGQAEWSRATFLSDRDAIDSADVVVMLYHGAYSDSGTAWEAGYACAKGKPVVVVHTVKDAESSSNLMVHESACTNISLEELSDYDFQALPHTPYRGNMF